MKKLFPIVLFLSLIGLQASAQFTLTKALAAGDTVVNTATVSKFVVRVTDGSQLVVHAIGTKISGTVAGTVAVYGSGDGTTYDAITAATTFTDLASQQETFILTGPLPEYLQVRWTGAGTMSAKLTIKYRLVKASVITATPN